MPRAYDGETEKERMHAMLAAATLIACLLCAMVYAQETITIDTR